jgi:hypothetical protein
MLGASHSDVRDGGNGWLLAAFLVMLWAWRLELALIAGPLVADRRLANRVGEITAARTVGLMVGLVLIVRPTRRLVFKALHGARAKRRWKTAARDADAVNAHGRFPRVYRVRRLPVGDELLVKLPRRGSVPELEKHADRLAAGLGARQVRVTQHPASARFARVVVVKRDALAQRTPTPWPWRDTAEVSLWSPVPVGVDENGQAVCLSLPERNVLIGGEPGAGKSAALSQLIAAAALDPNVKLWLLDGKMVELAAWAPVAERSAGINPDEAIEVMRALREEMDNRYQVLLVRRLRKVTEADGLPLHVVACDELAYYLTLAGRKQRTEFAELMRDLVSRGRAAGIVVLAATQKPSSEVVPTALRDLFGFRWAMRCNTSQASDTILGSGWATLGYRAAQIPGASRGVGYLLAEDGQPQLIRSYYLHDYDIDAIVDRAVRLRAAPEGAPA